MPDKYGFNHLNNWEKVNVECVESGCQAGGMIWDWPEDRRKVHFLTHNYETEEGNQSIIVGPKKTTICRICGSSFEQERKRGRPRVKCYVCKPE